MTSFFKILESIEQRDSERFVAQLPSGWMQGRTLWGGLTAALGYRAARTVASEAKRLRCFDLLLLEPIAAGEMTIAVRTLRRGKGTTFIEAAIESQDRHAATMNFVFGKPRESQIFVTNVAPLPSKTREASMEWPFVKGLTPEFTQHIQQQMSEGAPPFTGAKQGIIGGYLTHRTKARGMEAVIALGDAWPVPVLAMGTRPFPASTARWSFHAAGSVSDDFEGTCWSLSETVAAGEGYATTTNALYAEGRLIGWSEQLAIVFDG